MFEPLAWLSIFELDKKDKRICLLDHKARKVLSGVTNDIGSKPTMLTFCKGLCNFRNQGPVAMALPAICSKKRLRQARLEQMGVRS
jgi:hypothetical protein